MAFTSIVFMSLLYVCGATLTGPHKETNVQSAAAAHSASLPASSPETAVGGSNQLAQMNMLGGINEIVADAVKSAMAGPGESGLNALGKFPLTGGNPMMNIPSMQGNPMMNIPSMPFAGMFRSSMPFNPMSMFSGRGSPFNMMVPGMMMNMMENMFDIFSF